jgi:hypothetical protein
VQTSPDPPWRVRLDRLTKVLDLLRDVLREDLADLDRLDALGLRADPRFGQIDPDLRRRKRTLALEAITAASATMAGSDGDAELAVHVRPAGSGTLLSLYLDVIEDMLQTALANPRIARDEERRLCLTAALEHIGPARAAQLEGEGAKLAMLVNDMTVSRFAPEAAIAARQYRAALKGAAATKAKRRRRPRRHTRICTLAPW